MLAAGGMSGRQYGRVVGRLCGSEIPSAWVSGPRSSVAQGVGREVWGGAAETGQYVWSAASQSAGNARGFEVYAVRHGVAGNAEYGAVSQVRV
jgi:hypothetical protein